MGSLGLRTTGLSGYLLIRPIAPVKERLPEF